LIAASALAIVSVVALAAWYLLSPSNNQAGKPVPAPRSINIEQSATDTAMNGGQTLTIAPEQIERAGIKTEIVGEQISSEIGDTLATGVVQANAYRETPVISLAGGIVRRISPELGENVQSGQTVAVVFSDEFAAAQSRYLDLLAQTDEARKNYERTAKLVRINQPGRTEFDEATAQQKTVEAQLEEMKKRYQRTTKLIQIGASSREELEQDTTKLRTAEAELVKARARLERARQLLEINPATRTEFDQATTKLRNTEAELASTRQKLLLYGLSAQRVNALRTASQINSEIAVPAPISGTVTSRTVNQSEVIEANKELLRITDLSNVWVIAQVYERDLVRLRTGSGASVTTDAYPNQVFRGQITYIDPRLDENTRTAQVRVELKNPNRALKIGMYVRAAFGALEQAEQTAPIIPASATQNLGNGQVVFVGTNEPNVFEMRPVRLSAESNKQYQVFEGLNVGDRIVTDGSFLLRAEWLKQHPSN
jgi:RND family efflux transporter MFP subunit